MPARVTVCIPTYDRPRWLPQAIESVLAQTFEDFVLEIHDDATPGPAVREIAERYDDPRIRLIEHERNVGIVGNFSRSLLGASSEYVLQLGDDDEMHPQLLEEAVAALDRHPSAAIAHSRFDLIDEHGEVLRAGADWTGDGSPEMETGRAFTRASMLYGCRVCSSTTLIRRAAVPPGAFLQEDFPPFDFGCWLRMAKQWDVLFIPRALCRYRLHEWSHSSDVSALVGAAYVQNRSMLDAVYEVKMRHAHGDRELERLARRGRAVDALARLREEILPERRLSLTVRGLARAVRAEPWLAREPGAWSLLAGSALGPRAVARLRGKAS
jgi:cellulose synthase/poly-beta-1,6-N-acetylglucosamine synthase-like glycosyltransferase